MRWELAQHPRKRPASWDKDLDPGYPVDSGTGCFIDAANLQPLSNLLSDPAQFDRIVSGGDVNHLYWTWQQVILDAESGANVIMFRTGYGDGWYSTYYGYDKYGNVTELITECIGEENHVE